MLYSIWFVLIWAYLVFFISYKKNDKLRNQFIITFISCWLVLGNIFAVLLSSVGPCFIYLLDNNQGQYLDLISILKSHTDIIQNKFLYELAATNSQDLLWQIFSTRSDGVGMGISAMPSLHVSMAVLIALSSFKINSKLGYFMCFYAICIQIGSVHLGWHYAVDGYVSTILTIVLWYCWGGVIRKFNLGTGEVKK